MEFRDNLPILMGVNVQSKHISFQVTIINRIVAVLCNVGVSAYVRVSSIEYNNMSKVAYFHEYS